MTAAIIGAGFFLLFASSLSKMPYVYYLMYFAIMVLLTSRFSHWWTVGRLVLLSTIGMASIVTFLAALYFLQYPELYSFNINPADAIGRAYNHAFNRVFIEPYAVLLRFFVVYPQLESFAGWQASSLTANLMHLPFRNVDIEVPMRTIGVGAQTTNPTILVASAWAIGGYWSVAVMSLLVGGWIVTVDHILARLKSSTLKLAYLAATCLNVTIFATIAPFTVMLTFGMGVIPLLYGLGDLALPRLVAKSQVRRRSTKSAEPERDVEQSVVEP